MWVIGLIAGMAALALFLLIVPVNVTFFVEKDTTFRLGGTVSVLFGLIRKTWKSGKRRRRKEDGRTAKRRRFWRSGRSLRAALDTCESAGKILSCARDILRTIELRELYARFRIGLDDPGDTGLLFAALVPMTTFARLFPADVQIEPVFEKEMLEGHCRAYVRAVPIRFIRPLVPFMFSRAGWSLVKAVIRARRT